VFTVLYAALAAIAGWLVLRHVRGGAPEESGEPQAPGAGEPQPVFSY
jgi:cytochrome d ubiquinol oxidase subunit I